MNAQRQLTSFALVSALVLAAAGTLAPLATAAPAAQRPAPTPLPDYGQTTCTVSTTTQVQPGAFLVGEAVAITRTASAACEGVPSPLHIVLVLDASASMSGAPSDEMRSAMRAFVAGLEADHPDQALLGVVSFDEAGRQLCALTERFDRVQACIGRVRARGDADIGVGLSTGWRALVTGRDRWHGLPPTEIREVVILVSDGTSPSCDRARREAGQLAERGVLLISVCVGRGCRVSCMRPLATSPRYSFEAHEVEQLLRVFMQIRHQISYIILRQLTITETLPVDVDVVEDSAVPPPTTRLEGPTRLVWRFGFVPSDGVTVTYRVVPLVPGYRPLSEGMSGAFIDNRGLRGTIAFDLPLARILAPPEPGTP